ncbi:MAG TPA: hypothetical protein VNV66_16690 [Pilimelia sp.]|nr:hypothetical protein [Pilimelia sp.]
MHTRPKNQSLGAVAAALVFALALLAQPAAAGGAGTTGESGAGTGTADATAGTAAGTAGGPGVTGRTPTAAGAGRTGTAQPGPGDGHVYAVRPRDNGVVEYAVYTPAQGVTPAQLYQRLKEQGVHGLRDPQTPLAAYACTYGTARALDNGYCPPARWRWNGFADPQVYFRDFTPDAWPVRESVADWNRAYGVDSYWTLGSCPTGGRHCVGVHAANYGANGWNGLTVYSLDSGRYFIDGSVVINFNTYYAATAADRRNSTCHEIGHALGVGHNLSTASCVYSPDIWSNPQYPHSSDYNLLRYVIYP